MREKKKRMSLENKKLSLKGKLGRYFLPKLEQIKETLLGLELIGDFTLCLSNVYSLNISKNN